MKCGALISICCPGNPHEKVDDEERRIIESLRLQRKGILSFIRQKFTGKNEI